MTKEEKQRIYDALLIRAWRKDLTLNEVRYWLKPYNICITDKDLIRTSPYIPQRVVRFVGVELKPLSDKLFDGEPANDINVLNWLSKSGLRCQNTERVRNNEIQNVRRELRIGELKKSVIKDSLAERRLETKSKVPRRRITSRQR
jgi:hypothetical protein